MCLQMLPRAVLFVLFYSFNHVHILLCLYCYYGPGHVGRLLKYILFIFILVSLFFKALVNVLFCSNIQENISILWKWFESWNYNLATRAMLPNCVLLALVYSTPPPHHINTCSNGKKWFHFRLSLGMCIIKMYLIRKHFFFSLHEEFGEI